MLNVKDQSQMYCTTIKKKQKILTNLSDSWQQQPLLGLTWKNLHTRTYSKCTYQYFYSPAVFNS